jgi:hypothetical protein
MPDGPTRKQEWSNYTQKYLKSIHGRFYVRSKLARTGGVPPGTAAQAEQSTAGHNTDERGGASRDRPAKASPPARSAQTARTTPSQAHSVAQPFVCDTCNRRFTTWGELQIHHQRAHSDAKLFVCAKCGEGFESARALLKHPSASRCYTLN